MFVLMAVGYTMDKLYFSFLENPIDVDPDVILPDDNTRIDSDVIDCSMNYTTGIYLFYLFIYLLI